MVHHCSAGHEKHEYTTGCAFDEIFKFFCDESKIYFKCWDYLNDKLNELDSSNDEMIIDN